MSSPGEREPIVIPNRGPGEGTSSYRRKLMSLIPKRREPISKVAESPDRDRRIWREKSYDLIVAGYHGWIAEQGELENDRLGMDLSHGSAVAESHRGQNSFDKAYRITYGKQMSYDDFISDAELILQADQERAGIRYPKVSEFLTWGRARAKEIREQDQRTDAMQAS